LGEDNLSKQLYIEASTQLIGPSIPDTQRFRTCEFAKEFAEKRAEPVIPGVVRELSVIGNRDEKWFLPTASVNGRAEALFSRSKSILGD